MRTITQEDLDELLVYLDREIDQTERFIHRTNGDTKHTLTKILESKKTLKKRLTK